MPNVSAIYVREDKGITIRNFPVKDGKVHVSETFKPKFKITDFYPEVAPEKGRFGFLKFWKKSGFTGRHFLFLREGLNQAIPMKGLEFSKYWSKKESKKVIAKYVAESLESQKPFTNWQVIGLIIPLCILAVFSIINFVKIIGV